MKELVNGEEVVDTESENNSKELVR
jgi:hypothetical protein